MAISDLILLGLAPTANADAYLLTEGLGDFGGGPPPPVTGYLQVINSDQTAGAPLGFTFSLLLAVWLPLALYGVGA